MSNGWEKVFGDLNSPFLRFFWEISQIPRVPGQEGEIAEYLVNFADERGLKYYVDDLFNVIIYKPASPGFENSEPLGIQNHTDMICEKAEYSKHVFSADPLNIYVDGNYVKARGTTLGADNGLGVAYALAILDSNAILAPALECIFTTQEESTMNGVMYLDKSKITAKKIISFDSSEEDEMHIGCATCLEYAGKLTNERIELNGYKTYRLTLKDFKGGHSGTEIWDTSRANTIKIAMSLLGWQKDLYINSIAAGEKFNVISCECEVVFSIPEDATLGQQFYDDIGAIRNQYPEGKVLINLVKPGEKIAKPIKNTRTIINFVNSFENGPLIKDEYGNVIVSGSFGALNTDSLENSTSLKYSIRHNSKEAAISVVSAFEARQKSIGVTVENLANLLGYEVEGDNNDLIEYCYFKHYDFYGDYPKKIKCHAGLECGFLAEKIPGLQYVCMGPNSYEGHTINERFEIQSALKFFDYIVLLLEGWFMYNSN